MKLAPSRALLAVCVVVAGCGGGGGGTSLVDFLYLTNWGPEFKAESQKIQIINPGVGQVRQLIINNQTGGTQSVTFNGIPAGLYNLDVTLYSSPNASGTVIGVASDLITISPSSRSYSTVVGAAVAALEVHPSSATIRVQQSIQLYAVAKDGKGVTTFLPPGAITWEALTIFVSVNQQGIAVGQAAGQGVVRARDGGSGRESSAVIEVEPFQTVRTEWTIMVFLNSANDLDPYSDLNVNQMELVANNPQVRFVVQWKRVQSLGFGAPWSGTRRYLVRHDPNQAWTWADVRSELIQDMGAGVDMGNATTLREFVNWSQTFYPAERYAMVVWNHGSGWRLREDGGGTRGVSFDDEFFTHINTWELAQALATSERLDIVSWDASLMQMLEVAYEIKDRCDYVVGSEESPPADGLPYHLVFGPLRDNPFVSTEAFTARFGEGMLAYYGQSNKIEQSSVRTADLGALATAVDALADRLIATAGMFDAQIQQARQQAQSYNPGPARWYRDLWHLAFKLKELIADAGIDTACDAVMAAVDQAVVHEAHNNNSANSHGLSIEFGDRNQTYWTDYSRLALSGATRWDEWLLMAP